MADSERIRKAFEQHHGVLRMVPNWVPRPFNQPGRRLRLHPDDYFCYGLARGAIKERWFTSTVPAMNGPLAPADEGISKIALSDEYTDTAYFTDVNQVLDVDLFGPILKEQYGGWPMYCKFFDYDNALFHHLHHSDAKAKSIGKLGKPEAYFFPAELNNHEGTFPVTYFGYDPDVSKEEVKERLLRYTKADNRITELSRGFRLELDTGWYTPPGLVHAPGSLLTYEPQWNSDVCSAQENVVTGEVMGKDQLVSNLPTDKRDSIDAAMDLMDWEVNIDPHYRKKYYRPQLPIDTGTKDYAETWITYGNPYFAAKRTAVQPGKTVVLRDPAAYGCIIIQGHGRFGDFTDAEAATILRYNQLSADEYFVSEKAARAGVTVTNASRFEPMVILRHFGPNTDAPKTI